MKLVRGKLLKRKENKIITQHSSISTLAICLLSLHLWMEDIRTPKVINRLPLPCMSNVHYYMKIQIHNENVCIVYVTWP